MNSKAQVGVGALVIGFIAIITALAIYTGGVTPQIGTLTQTQINVNKTITAPAAGSSMFIDGQINNTVVLITNSTNVSFILPQTNYTITQDTSQGVIKLKLTMLTGVPNLAGKSINISYGYEPEGYVSDGGSRSVVFIIPLLAVLGIVAIAIWAAMKNGYLEDLVDSFK